MIRYFVLLAVLVATQAQAWNCKHEREINISVDLAGSEKLSVAAGAGDLEIVGRKGLTDANVRGRVCASSTEWLNQAEVITNGGRNAEVTVSLPNVDSGWSVSGNRYAYMDLYVEVPTNIALDVRDSSGDVVIESTGSVTVSDSSGDIEIEDVTGDVVLSDSSGDIDLLDIEGNVQVLQDSSGDIKGRDIHGSVLVERDSSGDIRFYDVRDDYIVERDSSGDIVAKSVGGDFRVIQDGSGEINSSNVSGTVSLPRKG